MSPHDPLAKRISLGNPSREGKLVWVRIYLRPAALSPSEIAEIEGWMRDDPSLEKEAASRPERRSQPLPKFHETQ